MLDETRTAVIPLNRCFAHPDNYNRHPAAQIAHLRASLREFGQGRSIVVWESPSPAADGEEVYIIVAGHGVARAAILEGWTEIRATVLPSKWPAEKVKAYLVADNKTAAKAEQDDVQLASILEEIADFDEDLLFAAGFGDEDLDELLNPAGAQDVRLKRYESPSPPQMAWVVVGIPLPFFGAIADTVEHLARHPAVTLETTVNDVTAEEEE